MSDKYSMEILQELEAALYKEADARIARDNKTCEQITKLQEQLANIEKQNDIENDKNHRLILQNEQILLAFDEAVKYLDKQIGGSDLDYLMLGVLQFKDKALSDFKESK